MATLNNTTISSSAAAEVPEIITKLVARFHEQRDTYMSGSYNETQVRRDFIDPFFKALGWDIDNESDYAEAYRDVIHEDMVLVGSAKKAPDYSFRIGGNRKFFVEAKKPSISINTDPKSAFQLRRYGWSAKLPLSILTDFEELAVYDCTHVPYEKHSASQARLHYFKYTEYVERWSEISGLFSKSAVMKGSFDRYAIGKKRGTTTVDKQFLAEIEQWRQLLASNILQNNVIGQRELNLAVQLIIDRIIFLRICEDRGIEDYERLLKLAKLGNIYPKLGNLFKDADDRYNSGLFHFNPKEQHATAADTVTLQLKVDNAPLKRIIESLYLPNPYEFSFIPADILGQVYERFLGKVIQVNGKEAAVEEKPDVKKAGGVFYTPSYVVEYIIKNTIDKLLEGKTPKQAEKLRIVDPACGSGSFLIVAYQNLLDWHLNYYIANGGPEKFKKEVFSTGAGTFRLTTQKRKSILLNSVYGVDVDAQAVEVTKLSLLLKVLEGESGETLGKTRTLFHERALPDLGNNVKCGNSLIGSDFYAQENLPHLTDEDDYRINAFDWKSAFSDIFKDGGFDVVIGNPPWCANIDDYLEYYSVKFSNVMKRKTDSYKLFLGVSLSLCKKDGLIGMIVPNTLLRQSRYQDVRTELLKYELRYVVDLGENVFEGAIVPSCVFILNKKPINKNKIKFLDASKLKDNASKEIYISSSQFKVLNQSIEMGQHGFRSDVVVKSITSVGECSFILLKDAGINYQRKNVGMSEKGKSNLADRLLYEGGKKTNKTDCMYWKGRDIDRYFIAPFTRHFCRPSVKKSLLANETVVLNENYFLIKPKILIRQTADKPIAALDESGVWFGRSLLGLTLAEGSPVSYEFVVGVLNSSYIEKYYQNLTGEKGRGFAQVKLGTIRQLPFYVPDFNNKIEKKLHDDITRDIIKVMELTKLAEAGGESKAVHKQIRALVEKVDTAVSQLFGDGITV